MYYKTDDELVGPEPDLPGKRKSKWKYNRPGPDSNRRIEILQTSALPLGYRAIRVSSTSGPGKGQAQ